jgi:1-deoxy-D-xylulose-5-phosphate synthase
MSWLSSSTGPADLTGLSSRRLAALAQEIGEFLIAKGSEAGRHLTLAVHRVLNSPCDVLLFDTGHQALVHEILTSRYVEFSSLRQAGGSMCWDTLNDIGVAPGRPIIGTALAPTFTGCARATPRPWRSIATTKPTLGCIGGHGALTWFRLSAGTRQNCQNI